MDLPGILPDRVPTLSQEEHMYVRVLEQDDFLVLVDPAMLWKPPRVIVRRGFSQAEVWLDPDHIDFDRPGRFSRRENEQILELVRENVDELLDAWHNLREDVRRGRIHQRIDPSL